MSGSIIIVDYGTGNLHTIYMRLKKLGAKVGVANTISDIEKADKLILPGVGHFGNAMETIKTRHLGEPLNESALVKKKPILGICLGMQLMANSSEEDNKAKGLGWIQGTVKKFSIENSLRFKVPHIGWNTINVEKKSDLMIGIDSDCNYYFTHSFHFVPDNPEDVLNNTEYGYHFVSAVERENLFGVQYHPEKSHNSGDIILRNFIKL